MYPVCHNKISSISDYILIQLYYPHVINFQQKGTSRLLIFSLSYIIDAMFQPFSLTLQMIEFHTINHF